MGEWFGQWTVNEEGETIEFYQHTVVCGYPEQRGECPGLPGEGWPRMWGIIRSLGLNSGGSGYGDAHNVHPSSVGMLKKGYYDFAKAN